MNGWTEGKKEGGEEEGRKIKTKRGGKERKEWQTEE